MTIAAASPTSTEPAGRDRVDRCFANALALIGPDPALADLRLAVASGRDRLDQPMRVAIVGLIKAGKSTMMNALLGESVVVTGNVEATFNINWLRYGDEAKLVVHYKDERKEPEERSPAELAKLTARADEHRELLLSIARIDVFRPTPILRTMHLIDTPGLDSAFADDTANTREFLRLHGDQLSAATRAQASDADAVLYLFRSGIGQSDAETVQQIVGADVGKQPTPINAIGVLTRIDDFWSDKYPDPMVGGEKIADRLRHDPTVRSLFYSVYPVSGLIAFGAQTLTEAQFALLTELAALPEKDLKKLINSASRFTSERPDAPGSSAERDDLYLNLGLYGVWLACQLIQAGARDRDTLSQQLYARSGLSPLYDRMRSHFGNRAYLLKLQRSLDDIYRVYFRARRDAPLPARATAERVWGLFEALQAQEHGFRELRVLKNLYNGHLSFDGDEEEQIHQVTGEFGTTCGARLGLDPDADLDTMLRVARGRVEAWRLRANDFIAADGTTTEAAAIVAQSYERIVHHLQEGERLLAAAKRHLTLEL